MKIERNQAKWWIGELNNYAIASFPALLVCISKQRRIPWKIETCLWLCKLLEAWQLKVDKTAGIMWLMVENTQRVHFRGIKDDPLKMGVGCPEGGAPVWEAWNSFQRLWQPIFDPKTRGRGPIVTDQPSRRCFTPHSWFAVHYLHPGQAGRWTWHNGTYLSSPWGLQFLCFISLA